MNYERIVLKGCLSEKPLDFVGQFGPDLFAGWVLATLEDTWGNWENWRWGSRYDFNSVFLFDCGGVDIDNVNCSNFGVEGVDVDDFNVGHGGRHVWNEVRKR